MTPSVTHSFDFWRGAKLSKASKDAYNRGGWLILWDLLNEWVAKGVAFDPHDFTLDAVQYIITLMCSFRFCAWLKCSSTHLSQWGQSYFWKYVARIRILLALFANWVTFFKTCKRQKDFCLLWIWLKQCSDTYQFEGSKKKHVKDQIFSIINLERNWFKIYFTENRQFYLILEFSERFWPHCDSALLCFFVVINGGIWVAFCSAFTVQVQPFPTPSWNYSAS